MYGVCCGDAYVTSFSKLHGVSSYNVLTQELSVSSDTPIHKLIYTREVRVPYI